MSPRSDCSLFLASTLLSVVVAAAQSLPLPNPASSSAVCPRLSAEEVVRNLVRRNLERAQALPAYRSTRTYRTVYRGFPSSRTAEMVVDVTFEPPGTKTFAIRSQTGSKLIIDRVFKKLLESEQEAADAENQKKTALNGDNYLFALAGCEKGAGDLMFVLTVEPKIKAKYLYRGKIWVDAADFAVTRISAEPAKNPSFWIKQTQIEQLYSKVKDFWLPASNRSSTSVRLGGHADFSIEYKDYQLASAPPASTSVARSDGQR
jgi:hypothetical protein